MTEIEELKEEVKEQRMLLWMYRIAMGIILFASILKW